MEKMQTIGEVSGCPRCNGQPLLFQNMSGSKWHCECAPCRVRLWACDTAQEAIEAWESLPRREVTE